MKNDKIEIKHELREYHTYSIEEALEQLDDMKKQILDAVKEHPNATGWEFEAKVRDNYGTDEIKFHLNYKRPATEKELAAEAKNQARNDAFDRQNYERLKKKFEK